VKAADAVVVTKCPLHIGEVERSAMAARLGLGHIPIFFSGLHYGTPLALRSQAALQAGDEVVVVTAIADARLFMEHVRASYRVVQHLEFRDHAVFTEQEIAQWGAKKSGQHVNVLTTEKDAMRLLTLHWPTELRVFYIPIEVVLIGDGEQERLSSLIRQKSAL
jgi:tetraacyldisaccharide 4'-kinase